jgi:hypothetical protein
LTVEVAADPDTVFDVIAGPYLGRTPTALSGEIQVLERGTDMVLAAHRTSVAGAFVATTVESVASYVRGWLPSGCCAAPCRM